jgi:hypothetical protein
MGTGYQTFNQVLPLREATFPLQVEEVRFPDASEDQLDRQAGRFVD